MKIDKLIKIVLKIVECIKKVVTKAPSNLKIYLVFKTIFKTSTQQIARYRIVALIPIGRLCMSAVDSEFPNCVPLNKDFPGTNI